MSPMDGMGREYASKLLMYTTVTTVTGGATSWTCSSFCTSIEGVRRTQVVFVLGRGDFVVKQGVRSITLIESKYIYIHECISYNIFIYIHVILPKIQFIFMVNK